MSIAEKIQELQRVQAKIELYERLAQNLAEEAEGEHKPGEDVELIKEFASEIIKFAKSRVVQLNSASEPVKQAPPPPKPQTVDEKKPTQPEVTQEDPLTFSLKWRKNEGKEVEFTTKDGVIKGYIRGVNPPNIVVETITGVTITIPPSELTVKG